jgi:rare lipoprotein A
VGLALSLLTGLSAVAAPAHHSKSHTTHRTQVGKASYYGAHHAGKTMANGKAMRPSTMIAASKTLPLGTTAKVTNLDTGKSVHVTVADRGPYVGNRILDVSTKAADKLDMKEDGVAQVKVQPLSVPSDAKPSDAKASDTKPNDAKPGDNKHDAK